MPLGLPLCTHRYDAGRDGFIDLMELKLMMEKLGAPQTHLGLKNMIKEVDEDFDSKLSFREVSPTPRGRSTLTAWWPEKTKSPLSLSNISLAAAIEWLMVG